MKSKLPVRAYIVALRADELTRQIAEIVREEQAKEGGEE